MSLILVLYFSATGTTSRVAHNLATAAGADIYEIKPKVPYTRADLDWMDEKSRTTFEMHNKTFRPELADNNISIEKYDTILLGAPIWWGVFPTVVNTFLESHDFTGKRIILFATSGGSGLGETKQELEPSAKGATIISGSILGTESSIKKFISKFLTNSSKKVDL